MEPRRFLADVMLGRLARWLRVLGFDAASADGAARDAELVRAAAQEGRTLLTRDRHLLRELRPSNAITIASEVPIAQLRQVVTECGLCPPAELFTRCLLCNESLELMPELARDVLLPPASREVPGPVRRCARCGRAYWMGAHTRRMRATLAGALPEWASAMREVNRA